MTTSKTVVRIYNGALQEIENGAIILRGVIGIESLSNLNVDEYQREQLLGRSLRSLKEAFMDGSGSVPDVILGMRGHRVMEDKVFSTCTTRCILWTGSSG